MNEEEYAAIRFVLFEIRDVLKELRFIGYVCCVCLGMICGITAAKR